MVCLKKTDNQLMLQLIFEENRQAFEELVVRYRKPAIQFAFRYCRDYHLAEDLAQEAFARIYIKREKFSKTGNFRAYFFRVLRNICIDLYRREGKIREEQLVENIVWDDDSATRRVSKEEHLTILKLLFRSLSERHKTVLYLYEFEGLTYQEIAKVMKCSQSQVRMRLYRARKKLKKIANKELRNYEGELYRIYRLE